MRAALFVLMLAGLVMSASIPQAFGERGLAFAAAYVFMQLGRRLFFLWAVRAEARQPAAQLPAHLRLVVAGRRVLDRRRLAQDETRLGLWAVALGIEVISPALYFWVPGLGRSSVQDWNVDGGHMAERCALFVIIALGESLLVSGATFATAPGARRSVAAFALTFLGAVAMWWLYFDKGLAAGHHRIAHADDPGRHARTNYTYLHLPIVAGIILCAVADELVLAHPDHAINAGLVVMLGGPALYLLGVGSFKWASRERARRRCRIWWACCLLALLAIPAALHWLSALAVMAGTVAVLVVVAAGSRCLCATSSTDLTVAAARLSCQRRRDAARTAAPARWPV